MSGQSTMAEMPAWVKWLMGSVAGLLVATMFTLMWNTFSKGVETSIGDNPAIVTMQTQVDKADETMTAHLIAVEGRLAGVEAKQGRIIDNQNLILDKLTQ